MSAMFRWSETSHLEMEAWSIHSVHFQAEEKKSPKVSLVPGQLLCLEHAVQQEYFAPHQARLLQTFLSRWLAPL